MRYLQMVIKETLRLFPVAFVMARELTEDIELGTFFFFFFFLQRANSLPYLHFTETETLMIVESCTLPSGCQVMIPICAIHRNPKYWPTPNEFIPERFAPGNSHNYDAYLPFGTGLRSCPGKRGLAFEAEYLILECKSKF